MGEVEEAGRRETEDVGERVPSVYQSCDVQRSRLSVLSIMLRPCMAGLQSRRPFFYDELNGLQKDFVATCRVKLLDLSREGTNLYWYVLLRCIVAANARLADEAMPLA